MGLTKNLKSIGMAAHIENLDNAEYILQAQLKERARQKIERAEQKRRTLEICDQIGSLLTKEEYDAWWESTPEDNDGFEFAAQMKLSELRKDTEIDLLPQSTLDPEWSDYMDARGVGIRP